MSAELITSTLLWFAIGWLVDRALGTMPWFMFAGALLGNWTGLYLLWLRGQRSEEAPAHGGHGGGDTSVSTAPPRDDLLSRAGPPVDGTRRSTATEVAPTAVRPATVPDTPDTTEKDAGHDDD